MPQHAGKLRGAFSQTRRVSRGQYGQGCPPQFHMEHTMNNTAIKQRTPQADRVGYTVEEAAQLCTLSARTLRNYIKSGQLVASRFGQRVVIPRENLLRFINSGDRPEARNG